MGSESLRPIRPVSYVVLASIAALGHGQSPNNELAELQQMRSRYPEAQSSSASSRGQPPPAAQGGPPNWNPTNEAEEQVAGTTNVPMMLQSLQGKNKAIVTGVVAGGAAAAVAGGIGIAIMESKINQELKEGKKPKPLFPWLVPKEDKRTELPPAKVPSWLKAKKQSEHDLQKPAFKDPMQELAQKAQRASKKAAEETAKQKEKSGSRAKERPEKKQSVDKKGEDHDREHKEAKPTPSPKMKMASKAAVSKAREPAAKEEGVAGYKETIPTAVWIALGILFLTCIIAVVCACVEAMKHSKKQKRSKAKTAPTSRSASRDSFEDEDYEDEDLDADAATVQPLTAPLTQPQSVSYVTDGSQMSSQYNYSIAASTQDMNQSSVHSSLLDSSSQSAYTSGAPSFAPSVNPNATAYIDPATGILVYNTRG